MLGSKLLYTAHKCSLRQQTQASATCSIYCSYWHHRLMPLPLPPRMPPLPMPLPGMAAASGASLRGFLTVSSTERIRQAASVALCMAFSLTSAGSQTKASYVLTTPPVFTSTPKYLPEPSGSACFCRSLLSTSVASKPALSHSCLGMTSSALA
eukprot:GHRR01036935.1.p1 GENE.GHRR01036935.1~~GHRR01036935.1.p1  ORF type:complete len:153 (-),score=28.89 GHRR01036935.1:456-914(-)